jgi:hypothetical protein
VEVLGNARHGEQEGVRVLRGLARRTGAGRATSFPREPCQLLIAAGIAEDDVMAGARQDRAELPTYQT